METIANFNKWIGTMFFKLEQQTIAFEELVVIFTESSVQLIRHDQVSRLQILKLRIMREVEDIKRMESAAQIGFTKGALLGSGVAFTLGSLFAAARGRKDASRIGLKLAISTLSKAVPFSMVLIAVGKRGLPDDLEVVTVSRLARESNKSESEVVTNLKNNGYLSMTPETFNKVLDKVERGILDGTFSLPINIDKLTKQIPEGC